jgi:hypothetical protein
MSSSRARSSFLSGALLIGLLPGACGDDLPTLAEETSSSSDGGSSDDAAYDLARLEILEPASASIHPLGEPLRLRAEVTNPEGRSLEVHDVAWLDTTNPTPLLDALEGDVELPAGIYALSAMARLPNGDRLQTTVGGVRVQARWTGEYTGDVVLLVQAQLPNGAPLVLRCQGPLDFVVSLEGTDAVVDDGACTISILGQSLPASYEIEMVIDTAGIAGGTVGFAFETPFGAFLVPVEWGGAFYDDRFSGGLSGSIELPFIGSAAVSGGLFALLVNRYVDADAG